MRISRTAVAVTAAVVFALLALGLWFAPGPEVTIRQQIFEPAHMEQGFQTMVERFPSRVVYRGENESPLKRSIRDLNEVRFSADGRDYMFTDLLEVNDTQGLVILHRGEVAYENYFGEAHPGTRFTSWSVAKSFTSTLVGMAIGDGLINSVEDSLEQYVPELRGTAYEGVTIAQALQMSSGVKFSEEYDGSIFADVTRFMGYSFFANRASANEVAASFPRVLEPGTQFNYNTAESQILGWFHRLPENRTPPTCRKKSGSPWG